MRMANCKTVCREIEESEVSHHLGEMVAQHLRDCSTCQEFYDSRLKLRQMVATLGTVKAPADFDFRLRARLASEKANLPAAFVARRQAFGYPSVMLATLALLVGVGLAVRSFRDPTNPSTIVRTESAKMNPAAPSVEPKPPAEIEAVVKLSEQTSAQNKPNGARPRPLVSKGTGRAEATSSSGRVAIRDFSSVQAPVVKREDPILGAETAAIFPIEASEPLKVSLDYVTGLSRTISLPSLSFGSQQVVSPGVSPMVKTSAKGVW